MSEVMGNWAELAYLSMLEGLAIVKTSPTMKGKAYALIQTFALAMIVVLCCLLMVVDQVFKAVVKICETIAILFVAFIVWVLSKLGVF